MDAGIVQLDRAAVLESVRVVDAARSGDWDRPTPCSHWSLLELVRHMTAQHYGFAAAAHGKGADATAWQPPALGDDPVRAYRTAARTVLDAFARPGVLKAEFMLPEISGTAFAGSRAVGFHFIDYVAHSWDVAATLGLPLELSGQTLDAALPVALQVPDGPARRHPGAAFRPALRPASRPEADGTSTLSLVLMTLGRSPDWRAGKRN